MFRTPFVLLLLLAKTALLFTHDAVYPRSFQIQNDRFVKDGRPIAIRSAEIHYARVPRAYWKDRLQRIQAMGMNAIATYVPWNWHEENEGNFNWEGERDIVLFLQIAHELGLMVLLRAGPYMCGEWEFGGFPAWILNKNVTIRTYEQNFIALVDRYWGALLDRVKPMLYSSGGPIIMLQVENEYGSYGDVSQNPADKLYMEHLIDVANANLGKGSVILYTTDGGSLGYMSRGSIPGDSVLTLGDGGWACEPQAQFNPRGFNVCMNSEDYTGWLTHWGEKMANTPASDFGTSGHVARGDSFNLYMGHGGSSFGFWSGANGGGKSFQPDITSYDFDSPVSENGDHGTSGGHDKYKAVLEAMKPFAPPEGFPREPPPISRKAYGIVRLTERAELLSNLMSLSPAGPQTLAAPVNMEALGQNYGLIYYESIVERAGDVFDIQDYPRDRAQVFVNGSYRGAIYRPEAKPLHFSSPIAAGSLFGILVENMGRLNYGSEMTDPKGIMTPVMLDGKPFAGSWRAFSIPLDYADVRAVAWSAVDDCSEKVGPVFYKGTLEIDGQPEDTWLRTDNWTKGIMWVNGFNLGRYWVRQGPQQAFYMPAPYLKLGPNEVVILELDQGYSMCSVSFDDRPDFSGVPAVPCESVPQIGDILHWRSCDASSGTRTAWELRNGSTSARRVLALGDLCLGREPVLDPHSEQLKAALVHCTSAVEFEVKEKMTVDAADACLSITAEEQTFGERVEWRACRSRSHLGRHQSFEFTKAIDHLH